MKLSLNLLHPNRIAEDGCGKVWGRSAAERVVRLCPLWGSPATIIHISRRHISSQISLFLHSNQRLFKLPKRHFYRIHRSLQLVKQNQQFVRLLIQQS